VNADLDVERDLEDIVNDVVPCETEGCDHEAQWSLLLHLCGHVLLFCSCCRSRALEIERSKKPPLVMTHTGCKVPNLGWTWRRL
jgi:hypothetical protein